MIAEKAPQKAPYTIFGASGFVGGHLVAELRKLEAEYYAPARGDDEVFARPLGHVIYCIGLTADWRSRPYDTVRAHVTFLAKVLERASFQSLLYLSSTRIYKRVEVANEDGAIPLCPIVHDDLFDISKVMGESLCFSGPENIRVARLSNVYGDDYASRNFLPSIMRDAVRGAVLLETAEGSSKDYIGVDEVAALLLQIAAAGKQRLYNVASGRNTTHREIVDALTRATGCTVRTAANAPTVRFPPISVARIENEFGFRAGSLIDAIGPMAEDFSRNRKQWESL